MGFVSLVLLPLVARAEEGPSAPRLMPPSALAYVEVTRADLLVERALDPALWTLLEQAKDVQKYYASEQYKQAQVGIALIEARMNAKWPQIVRDLSGSVHVGFDPDAQAALLALRVRNQETLAKLHSTLVDLVELDAASKGQPSPVKSKEYQGVTGWTFGKNEYHAVVDDLFLSSNKQEGLKGMVDRLKDPSLENLAGVEEFKKAHSATSLGDVNRPAERGGTPAAWGMLRLADVREAPKLKAALERQSDNPLAELLAGGILEVLKESPLVVGSLHVSDDQWRLKVELPRVSQASQARAWYFAQPARPAVPITPQGTIASLLLNRDVAGMWMSRDELFDEATRTKMAQADSGLGLYFAGRDFGTQVLGELSSEWQLVFARQEFVEGEPVPSVKLPAAALVIQMKQPDQFANTLLLGYQKVIGLANLVGAEKGNPQLLLGGEEYKGVSISKATFLTPPETDLAAASIHYNASPSCARIGNRFVFGSTLGVVKSVIDVLKEPTQQAFKGQTLLSIDLQQVAAVLDDNRAAIVSQNMLKEGNTREEAEQEVGVLLSVLKAIRSAALEANAEQDALSLEISVGAK
jgi:hypothetical protein